MGPQSPPRPPSEGRTQLSPCMVVFAPRETLHWILTYPWVVGGFFRTDCGGRLGPGTREAAVLELIQTETGMLVSEVGVGGGMASNPPSIGGTCLPTGQQCGSGILVPHWFCFFIRWPTRGHASGSLCLCVLFCFLSLIVVTLKGNEPVIPVLLRKQRARQSLHCDYDYVNLKHLFI